MDRNNFAEILKEPDEIIRAVARILDALQFTARMEETDNCNTCGKKYTCEYAPEPGGRVTWNCPLWIDPEDTAEEKLINLEGMNQEELERLIFNGKTIADYIYAFFEPQKSQHPESEGGNDEV